METTEKKTPEQFAANLKTYAPGLYRYIKLGHITPGVKNKKGELRDLFNMPFKTTASGERNAVYSTPSAWGMADKYVKGEYIDVVVDGNGYIQSINKSQAENASRAATVASAVASADQAIAGEQSPGGLPF